MKDLFVWLLLNAVECGEIKTATMFNGDYSSFTITTEDGEYFINITKNNGGVARGN